MEWLRYIFGCRACAAFKESNSELASAFSEVHQARNSHIRSLELEIEDLKEQRDKLQEALFRSTRLTPSASKESITQSKANAGERFTGSKRNWNEVRSEFERRSRKPTADDQAKHDSWQAVNAKAEQEIPELATALAERQVIGDKTDVEILAEN